MSLALVGALLGTACSVGAATDNVGTLDGPAKQACGDAQALAQAMSKGEISQADLRARVEQIYNEASASSNPIIKAKAVALYADGSSAAMGGEGVHLGADLQDLSQNCGPAAG